MNIKYYVKDGMLTGFDITLKEGTNVIDELMIPSSVDGHRITRISSNINRSFGRLCSKKIIEIKNVLVEEGITSVGKEAFARIHIRINRVCWPASCEAIPDFCFYNSCIECVKGIENVRQIGIWAFSRTNIKSFDWPKACKIVPLNCFYECSSLEQINGLEAITDIQFKSLSLSGTAIKTFYWPENVRAAGIVSFLDDCNDLEEIIFWGTEIKTVDLRYFFYLKNIKKIDLSGCAAVNLLGTGIPEYAEFKRKLLLPYYVTEIN